MAVLTRLLSRHWDGRRLLRFLAGLALLTLAFTAPAAPAAPAVAAPAPAVAGQVAEAPAVESTTADSATKPVASAAVRSATRSRECMHDGSGVARGERPAGRAAALAGVTLGAYGSRGPPSA